MSIDDPDDTSRDARLNALQIRFRTTLQQRVDAIVAGASAVRVGPWPGKGSEALLEEVHGLAGSAGLFGQDRIGEAAAAMEKILMRLARRKATTAVDIAMIRDAAQRLKVVHAQSTSP